MINLPVRSYGRFAAKILAIGSGTLLVFAPYAMAQQDLLKGNFSTVLNSLRNGTSDPKESNDQLKLKEFSIQSGGVKRKYFVHAPAKYDPAKPLPLVLAFHGAGMHARGMPRLTGLNECADKHNFILVYPDGLDAHWNDGAGGKTAAELTDVTFIKALLTQIQSKYKIDKKRIYACGMSNGGFFSQYLAINTPGIFSAIASVAASIEEPTYKKLKPDKPISVLLIHGDDDDVVPFAGGSIGVAGALEEKTTRRCTSAAQAAEYWAKADQILSKPTLTKLPDSKPPDGTHVTKKCYAGGKEETEVILMIVENGGHTWPSGWQYLPADFVGKTTRAINANDEIWAFFQRHQLIP